MKKILFVTIFLLSFYINAQIPLADELVIIHSVTNLTDMNTIVNPTEGALAFNKDDKHTYQYSGTEWQRLVIEKEIIKPLSANYTLTTDDDRRALIFNSTTDITLTVPAGLNVGFNVSIYQAGDGKVIIAGNGTTIKNRLLRFKTAGLNAAVGLLCTSTNTFHASGDLKR